MLAACSNEPREPTPYEVEMAKSKEACANDGGKMKAILSDIVDHAEGGSSVFVKRGWYGLLLKHKELYAAGFTACYSQKDYIYIYDAYTGKELAHWGDGGLRMKD